MIQSVCTLDFGPERASPEVSLHLLRKYWILVWVVILDLAVSSSLLLALRYSTKWLGELGYLDQFHVCIQTIMSIKSYAGTK